MSRFMDALKGKTARTSSTTTPQRVKAVKVPTEVALLQRTDYTGGRTANAAVTHSTSQSALVDLFFQIGAMRNVPARNRAEEFLKAYRLNPLDALRMIFYARDVRGGQGERETFRVMFRVLCLEDPAVAALNLHLVPVYGRWDDMYVTQGTTLEAGAVNLWATAIKAKDGLACKWAPREKSARSEWALRLRNALGWSAKAYRKFIAANSKTVEQAMCAGDWETITYEHVPAQAMSRLRKAFAKHDGERFTAFKGAVKYGKTKINAGTAIHPHEILAMMRTTGTRSYRHGYGYGYAGNATYRHDDTLELQWKALKDFAGKSGRNALVVTDVSGSMEIRLADSKAQIIDVAIAIAVYCGERLSGPYKDHAVTFSDKPTLVDFSKEKTLAAKATKVGTANWAGSTNIEAVFDLILGAAVRYGLTQDELPSTLIVVSDMEFNHAGRGTNYAKAANKFAQAGFKLPEIVWWNVNARPGNNPVRKHETGTALISGYSPSILSQVLGSDLMTPERVMRKVLDGQRYEAVRIQS